jgi:hypothetical protein
MHFVFLRNVRRLLVTANVPSSTILVTLMMEVLSSSKTLVLTRATWRNIPEDTVLVSCLSCMLPYIIYIQFLYVLKEQLGLKPVIVTTNM